MSKGKDKQLETASTNQGGGVTQSSNFRVQVTFGESVAGGRLTSSKFRVAPGFIGAGLSGPTTAPKAELDLSGLYAKTDPFGTEIPPQRWQGDNTPIFIWLPPETSLEMAGYSYAFDAEPDATIETAATSFDIAASALKSLPDGQHTFSVKAVNTAGAAGKALSIELWVDTTPPQIAAYDPTPGALLNAATPTIHATVTDTASGVNAEATRLFLNGGAVSGQFDADTGLLTARGGSWNEGANSIELRVADVAGNTQVPLVWSVTVDTIPPVGGTPAILINGGSSLTTSIYATLGLSATDATSGVARVQLSNQEVTGYVEEPYVTLRELWKLNPVRGPQTVFARFVDRAGNVSSPLSATIEVGLLAPETVIMSGPAGFTPNRAAAFTFTCPEKDCVYSYAFDNDPWSAWDAATTATKAELAFGNHYFRVKAAKEVNGTAEIQADEEDPSPAERTWTVGVEPPILAVPKGPAIKVWRLE